MSFFKKSSEYPTNPGMLAPVRPPSTPRRSGTVSLENEVEPTEDKPISKNVEMLTHLRDIFNELKPSATADEVLDIAVRLMRRLAAGQPLDIETIKKMVSGGSESSALFQNWPSQDTTSTSALSILSNRIQGLNNMSDKEKSQAMSLLKDMSLDELEKLQYEIMPLPTQTFMEAVKSIT